MEQMSFDVKDWLSQAEKGQKVLLDEYAGLEKEIGGLELDIQVRRDRQTAIKAQLAQIAQVLGKPMPSLDPEKTKEKRQTGILNAVRAELILHAKSCKSGAALSVPEDTILQSIDQRLPGAKRHSVMSTLNRFARDGWVEPEGKRGQRSYRIVYAKILSDIGQGEAEPEPEVKQEVDESDAAFVVQGGKKIQVSFSPEMTDEQRIRHMLQSAREKLSISTLVWAMRTPDVGSAQDILDEMCSRGEVAEIAEGMFVLKSQATLPIQT